MSTEIKWKLRWASFLLLGVMGLASAQPATPPEVRAEALRAQADRGMFRPDELRAALHQPNKLLCFAASDVLRR